MTRRVSAGTGRLLIAAALPLAAAVTLAGAGTATADPTAQPGSVDQPSAPLALQNIATDPSARDSDPVHNGAAFGASAGSAADNLMEVVAGPVVPVLLLQAGGSATVMAAGGTPAILAATAAVLAGAGSFALSGAAVGAAVGAADPQIVPQSLS